MGTLITDIRKVLTDPSTHPASEWNARVVRSDDCVSYVAWNDRTKEAIVVDPKDEDWDAYINLHKELKEYLWLGVIDTHTHADHISVGAKLAIELKSPYIMSEKAISPRVQVRVSSKTVTPFPSKSAPLQFIPSPGHTPDSVTLIWGPFIFGGDTVLYGDVGRDDLPGGSPEDHYASLVQIKTLTTPHMILLPGHDHKGGRASSWKTQLEVNTSLTQSKDEFIREATAFDAPAPALLKKSLKENFK